jgi:tryptophan halogenase
MKKVVVIGGGTAGWITALFVKKHFSDSVTVISPESIDILGAGEGSVPNMPITFSSFGIDIKDFLTITDATIKTGIEFINWNKNVEGSFNHLFTILEDEVEKNSYGFHFNARKTADYLESFGKNMGIQTKDEVIKKFIEDSDGNIIKIITESGLEIDSDFIFDCSGFSRLLIGKHFKSDWKSYSQHLICNKAFGFFLPQDMVLDINSKTKTKSISMSSGWMWQIPLQNRWGCGYVFNDNFISVEDAKKEVEDYIGKEITIQKVFDFNPGVYEETWKKNCVALGLSSGFIEPLEATSIMTLIVSLNKLKSYNIFELKDKNKNDYNKRVINISEQIMSFLVNHYKCGRLDTPFWRHIHLLESPTSLQEIKNTKELDSSILKKIFGVSIIDNLMFNQFQYQLVDYGHTIKKNKNTLI